jgi:hypothetical protein
LAIAVLVVAAGLAGCARDGPSEAAPPTTDLLDAVTMPPRREAPPSTAPLPDTRGVELTPVTGPRPTTAGLPLEVYGGEAALSGSLAYSGEPVEGATVHLERWVDGQVTAVELTTGPGGGWAAPGIHGGRYVIRAWKGTRLVLPHASAVFIAEDEERAVHLAMTEVVVPDDDEEDDDEEDDDEDDDHEDDDESGDEDDSEDESSGDDDDTTTTTEDGE